MRILFVGGGSIGHIAPSVAVYRALQKLHPSVEAHFVCAERNEEAEFLQREKIPFTQIRGHRFHLHKPWDSITALNAGSRIIRHWKPDVIFCKGGALCVAVIFAAWRKNIPIVLHESDAIMGRANRLIARWVKIVCLGFPSQIKNEELRSKNEDSKEKSKKSPQFLTLHSSFYIFTGNPIRPEITQGIREKGLQITGLRGIKPILFVAGGSQGAIALNDAVRRHLSDLLPIVDIVHLTGKGKRGAGSHAGYWSAEFAQGELPRLYAIADLALSRSGAGSIGELAANGIPSILVPLRGLAQDHQQKNAEVSEKSGGCIVLQQGTLDEKLLPTITELVNDVARRKIMGTNIKKLFVENAAERIAEILMKTAGM